MVVGGMVGRRGVLAPPPLRHRDRGVGALIAWAIAGTGMLMLAFVFQRLAVRKPDLDSGVYAYAKAGFGEYLGFFSAFGYWASACVGQRHLLDAHHVHPRGLGPVARGTATRSPAVALSTIGIWAFAASCARASRRRPASTRS